MSMGETTVENSIEVSQKLKIELWYDSANPLLGIYPKELKLDSPRGISIPIFVATLFTITNTGKQPKCPLMNEWINICYIYIYVKWSVVCVCPQSLSCVWLFFDPMEGSLPSSSDHGVFQARILERVAISSSRGSSQSRDRTWVSCVSCNGRWIIYHWPNWEAHNGVLFNLKKKETFSFAITEMT